MEGFRKNFRIISLAFFLVLFSVLSCFAAQNRIIDDIEIIPYPSGTEIHILFNYQFQYINHTPSNKGDFLQIQLRPVSTPRLDINDLVTMESGNWEQVPIIPLAEILYNGQNLDDPDLRQPNLTQQDQDRLLRRLSATLQIRFNNAVSFKVEPAPDLRSIIIILPEYGAVPVTAVPTKKREAPTSIPDEARFAIQLLASQYEIAQAKLPPHYLLDQYILYSSTAKVDGQTWYRWRLGFFMTEKEAAEILRELQPLYPEAWVVQVITDERRAHPFVPRAPEKIIPSTEIPERKTRPLDPERLASMLEDAEKAMTEGDYRRAIQLYTRILEHPDPEQQKKALELLGLARDRNGQQAHAKALYEEYLQRYPDDPGADRVRQRLAGILTARSMPKEDLRKARTVAPENVWEKDFFGSISQFYRYQESVTDGIHNEDEDSLSSDADLNMRLRSKDFDFQASFAGSNDNDFTDTADDDARLSVLYVDALAKKIDLYARIGRQTENRGGILGRFDGIFSSYRITPTIKINGVFGYPVESTRDTEIITRKHFYGVNFDFGTFWDSWDFNTFFISQEVDGITDRRAIGAEMRYFDPRFNFFNLVDYDISYDELNTLLLVGNLTVLENTLLRFNIDYRRSPLLTTSNALISQTAETIEELLASIKEEQIRDLAEDRTAESTSMSIGITQPLNEKWQVDADATNTELTGTPASGGIAAQPGTGEEYFYNLQFIGSSLVKEGDVAIFGIRYDDLDNTNTVGLSFNGRYPFTRSFRINPRLIWDYRKEDDGDKRYRWRPSLRADYSLNRYFRLETEVGSEMYRQDNAPGTLTKYHSFFAYLGYRLIY